MEQTKPITEMSSPELRQKLNEIENEVQYFSDRVQIQIAWQDWAEVRHYLALKEQ